MPKGKKRLTQREKAERAAIKKQLQADGVLPPDKPRLNRKKFAREVWDEFSEMDVYTADFYLRKAIMATVGPELHEVTSEQVGILKLMKLAVKLSLLLKVFPLHSQANLPGQIRPKSIMRSKVG